MDVSCFSKANLQICTRRGLYIIASDLPNVSNKIKIYLFADDTNIYVESETISELVEVVNNELKLVKNWIDANLLSLNISNTKYIIFHSPVMSIPYDIVIKIGRDHIDRSRYVKHFGTAS